MVTTEPALGQVADSFFHHMLNEGVYFGKQGFFVLSTAMTETDIDFILEKSEKCLRAITAEAA